MGGPSQPNAPHLQHHHSRLHHSSTPCLHHRNSHTDHQATEARYIELRLPTARSDDGERNTLWHEHFAQLLLHRRGRFGISAHHNQRWDPDIHPQSVGLRLSVHESGTSDAFHPEV